MAALGPFPNPPRFAVAVSGGPDSLVLAALAQTWAKSRDGNVHALIIDHRLRGDSSHDVAVAVGALDTLGITHSILPWRGILPSTALQETARDQRYALLEAAAFRLGFLYLLLGHHQDDQTETIAMRSERPANAIGLSGMSARRNHGRVRILRPLLNCPKAALLAAADETGIRYAIDPSNRSPEFERARVRREPDKLLVIPAQQPRIALETAWQTMLAQRVRFAGNASLRMDRAPLEPLAPNVLESLLNQCLRLVRGQSHGVRRQALSVIANALQNRATGRHSLGGCIIDMTKNWIAICREPDRIDDRQVCQPNRVIVWDQRFRFVPKAGIPPLIVAKLGKQPGRQSFANLARAALPALWQGDELVSVLELHKPSDFGDLSFLPARPLIEPRFLTI